MYMSRYKYLNAPDLGNIPWSSEASRLYIRVSYGHLPNAAYTKGPF